MVSRLQVTSDPGPEVTSSSISRAFGQGATRRTGGMNKKYKRYLDEIERTEAKIAELQEYLKITKAALKQEEELEMITQSIR